VREVGYDSAFTFIYSPRAAPPAAAMAATVPEEVKKERPARLNARIAEKSLAANRKLVGQTVEVLVEGASKNNPDILSGRTRGNKLVHFRGPESLTGTFTHVKITDTQTWYLNGELVASQDGAATTAAV